MSDAGRSFFAAVREGRVVAFDDGGLEGLDFFGGEVLGVSSLSAAITSSSSSSSLRVSGVSSSAMWPQSLSSCLTDPRSACLMRATSIQDVIGS